MEIKRKTLAKVAKALNGAGITWALGGSGALYFLGALDGFRDVDLMLLPADVKRATQLFDKIEGLEFSGFEKKYDLFQYRIDGLDFDVMQGFRFGEYHYILRREDIVKVAMADGVQIPLHSLRIWREFYRLMGRHERITLIDCYIE